jgi:hypothetical protein
VTRQTVCHMPYRPVISRVFGLEEICVTERYRFGN